MATAKEKLDKARTVKEKVRKRFGKWPQVGAFAITRAGKEYAVKISLTAPLAASQQIPGIIDGVPIVVQETGPIRKLPLPRSDS